MGAAAPAPARDAVDAWPEAVAPTAGMAISRVVGRLLRRLARQAELGMVNLGYPW
jgi:hypothetical protein